VSVKPSPVIPVPAASLVLLRDRPAGGIETLLIQRHQQSRFAAGDFVFPGGKLEAEDTPEEAAVSGFRLDVETAARRLDLGAAPRTALAYLVGAIREAFEEVGVLLADGVDGRPVLDAALWFADYRRACQQDHRAFWGMLCDERLTLATDRLVYFAHWITPEEQPLRFDTRFFAAPMPDGQQASADEREIVAVRWLTPAEAFDARARGEISLRLPTMKNLALMTGARSVAEALHGLQHLQVTAIRPRLVVEGDARRAILPGEPGYY